MTAKEFLKQKGIHPTEPIYWDLENTRISLDELIQEYHDIEVKKLNIPIVVRRNELLICDNYKCKHLNKEYDGYCSQSCFDGIQ